MLDGPSTKEQSAGCGDRRRGGSEVVHRLFRAILRLDNVHTSFDESAGAALLTERQSQDYRSVRLDLHPEWWRGQGAEKEVINDDVVFEIELIKQVEINVVDILMLVRKRREARGDGDDKEIRAETSRAVDARPTLRDKRNPIEAFVDSFSAHGAVDAEWRAFVAARREANLGSIIAEENLRPAATRAFIDAAFRDGGTLATGTAFTKLLPPASRFDSDSSHGGRKARVVTRLGEFFDRFFGLSNARLEGSHD